MVEQKVGVKTDTADQNEKEIRFLEIAALETPLKTIIDDIQKDGTTYDLIIGDDTSGRIPTLIVSKVLNRLNERKGFEPISVRFAGGHRLKDYLREHEMDVILRRIENKPKRILLVTDYVKSGRTIKDFADFFTVREINYDVACITLDNEEEYYRKKGRLPAGINFYCGEQCHSAPYIWDEARLTGLKRRSTLKTRVIRDGASFDRKVKEAREDVNILAQRLIDHFVSEVT